MTTYPYTSFDVDAAYFAQGCIDEAQAEHITPQEIINQCIPEPGFRQECHELLERGLVVLRDAHLVTSGQRQLDQTIMLPETIAPVIVIEAGERSGQPTFLQVTLRKR
jgi:hypothetical protein